MSLDAVSCRRRRAPRTARHALCIVRQGSRRHPWRKSRPLQAGAKRAPGWNGRSLADSVERRWLRPTRSASLPRGCQLQLRSSWELVYARQQKAPVRVGSEMKGHRAGLTVACRITPHPPQGGFGRPSNITRDYAQWSCATLPRSSVGCTSPLSAAPHNQRYV